MKKSVICMVLAGLTLFVCQEVMAELFKWVDEKGVIHISDYLPKNLGDNPNIITISERKENIRQSDSVSANQDPQGKIQLNTKSSKTIWRDKNSKMEIYAGYDGPDRREVCISFPFSRIPFRDDERDKDKSPPLRKR
jgi:hypothetical protein